MAIKALMLRKKLDTKKAELEALRAKEQEFITREAELEKAVAEANTEEERSTVEAEVETFTREQSENNAAADGLQREVEGLEAELAAEEAKQEEPAVEAREENKTMEIREALDIETRETQAFADYIRTKCGQAVETRDNDYNMIQGNNGGIVPKTIANQIITKIKEISPIFELAHKYPVKGTLEVPYYPYSSSHVIAAGYQNEMAELVASSGDLGTVELTGFLAGALAKVSKKLLNNTDLDLVSFVVEQMAVAFKEFYEHECIVGTSNKATGMLAGITAEVTGTYKSSVTADDLIDLQCKVPTGLQQNCRWLMAPATFAQIKKLKDGEGRYILDRDFREGFGWLLLGKPVDLSENMPALGTTGNKAVVYGDYSGLAVKMAEELEITVLLEKFSTQHAVGVMGWTEIDTKVENAQKLAVIKCGSSDPQ